MLRLTTFLLSLPHPLTPSPLTEPLSSIPEKPMPRAPVRGWWALPVAAGLTLIVPASAQLPGLSRGAPHSPPMVQRTTANVPVEDDASRLAEINTELGWLADPMTSPYHLAAHAHEGALVIRGYVPNKAVRIRVAKVALERSHMQVVDQLKIHPVMPHLTTVPTKELHVAAQTALRSTFPRQATGINVMCRSYGQVILTGHVASMEEKLAISQHLRNLPGCTSVLNQLAVGFVTAHRPPVGPKGITPVSGFQDSRQVMSSTRIEPQATPLPVAGTTGMTSPYAAATAPVSPYGTMHAAKTIPPSARPLTSKPNESRILTATAAPVAAAGVDSAGAGIAGVRTALAQRHVPVGASTGGLVVQTSYRPEGVHKGMMMAMRGTTPPLGEPYVSTGMLIYGDVSAAVPPAPVRSAPPPAVHYSAPSPVRPAVASAKDSWARRQEMLKYAIQQTCGAAVQDVHVELRSSKDAVVRFRAASKTEADRLWNTIQRIPELTPYKLDVVIKTR